MNITLIIIYMIFNLLLVLLCDEVLILAISWRDDYFNKPVHIFYCMLTIISLCIIAYIKYIITIN